MTDYNNKTLLDMVGRTTEILGRTFTIDWINVPKTEPDHGKIMVQSAEIETYHIGDKTELYSEVEAEIRHEMVKRMCVITLDEQITRYAKRITTQVCGGFTDNNTIGGLVDVLIIQEAVRRRLTDSDVKEESVFSTMVESREKKRQLNAEIHGKKVI